jgi:hypothetical protein
MAKMPGPSDWLAQLNDDELVEDVGDDDVELSPSVRDGVRVSPKHSNGIDVLPLLGDDIYVSPLLRDDVNISPVLCDNVDVSPLLHDDVSPVLHNDVSPVLRDDIDVLPLLRDDGDVSPYILGWREYQSIIRCSRAVGVRNLGYNGNYDNVLRSPALCCPPDGAAVRVHGVYRRRRRV